MKKRSFLCEYFLFERLREEVGSLLAQIDMFDTYYSFPVNCPKEMVSNMNVLRSV